MGRTHNHGHGHSHDHGHGADVGVRRLSIACGVNVGFAVLQVAVGLALGSVVVLADALHQAVDAIGLVTALIALRLAARPSNQTMTFGWGKADALGAFTSGLLLLGSIAWVVYESIGRLFSPVEVEGGGVALIGVAGVVVNGVSVLALTGASGLAIRAARLHLIVDLGGSVLVIITGALLSLTGWDWLDPVASLILNAVVLQATLRLLRTASDELLDRVPGHVTVADVEALLLAHDDVEAVHHVHIRGLGNGSSSTTAHVVVRSELSLHDAQDRIEQLTAELGDELGVAHTTLQLECHECAEIDH